MRSLQAALILAFALSLAGCVDEKSMVQKFTPKEDDAFVRQFFEVVKNGDDEHAAQMLDDSIRAQASNGLWQMRVVLAHGEPLGFDIIGANVEWSGTQKRDADLVYQIHFADSWVLATARVETKGNERHITGAHVQPLPDSLEVLNRFSFKGRGFVQYLIFGACVCVPLFIVATIVICIRSHVRRRWLWIIFILLGVGQLQFDWSSAAWRVTPISFNLLGAGATRAGPYAPWVLTVGFPLGALMFLLLRPWLIRKPDEPLVHSDTADIATSSG